MQEKYIARVFLVSFLVAIILDLLLNLNFIPDTFLYGFLIIPAVNLLSVISFLYWLGYYISKKTDHKKDSDQWPVQYQPKRDF